MAFNQGLTSKSLRIKLDSLDTNYRFYRLAFVQRGLGTGEISEVFYTEELNINNPEFIFTGNNYNHKGDIKEINAIVEKI